MLLGVVDFGPLRADPARGTKAEENMDELAESRQRALRNQGWLYGERLHRIGHPFEWLDGEVDNPNLSSQTGISGFIQNLSMFL